jgi:glycosyltransferase involved in cell wall biosynthesis
MLIWLVTADFPPNTGGVATHVAELGRSLSNLGNKVVVHTLRSKSSVILREFPTGMTVNRLRIPKAQPIFNWCLRRHLRANERREKPDVVHVHGIRPLTATRKLSVPVVFTNHTSGFLKRIASGERQVSRIGRRLQHLSHVLAPSEELLEATRTAGYKGPATYVPNGVDPFRFKPAPSTLRKKINVAEEDIVILVARRLVPKNGVLDFAKSTRWFKDLPVRLLFAGDGPEKSSIQVELEKHDMTQKSIFLGNVPNEKMTEVYNAADLSVLPSHMEATSITGLESLSSALPLVGTNVGGIPELIHSGKNGFLVPAHAPDALGKAIREVIANREQLKEMGLRSVEISKDYHWSKIAARTLFVYRSL